MLLMARGFGKNVPKYGAWCKNCSLKKCSKISAEMFVKQRNIFCHLLYASTITHCKNWLVKLTLGLEDSQAFSHSSAYQLQT
jgi:hypothetical protein